MKVCLYKDERYPDYWMQDFTEDSADEDCFDIPENLYFEVKKIREKYNELQDQLEEIYNTKRK